MADCYFKKYRWHHNFPLYFSLQVIYNYYQLWTLLRFQSRVLVLTFSGNANLFWIFLAEACYTKRCNCTARITQMYYLPRFKNVRNRTLKCSERFLTCIQRHLHLGAATDLSYSSHPMLLLKWFIAKAETNYYVALSKENKRVVTGDVMAKSLTT